MGRSELLAACFVCVLAGAVAASVAVVPAAGVVPTVTPDGGIGDVSIAGPAVVETNPGSAADAEGSAPSDSPSETTFWRSEPFRTSLTIADYPDVSQYRVCAYAIANGTRSRMDCERATISNSSTKSVNITGLTWSANASVDARIALELYPAAGSGPGFDTNPNADASPNADSQPGASTGPDAATPLDNRTLEATVLTKGGDADGDGLANEAEGQLGLDPLDADMDRDGLTDGTEVDDYGTSPRTADTDGDGVRDGEEVQIGSDPTEVDTDGDGLTDDTELATGTDPTSPRTTERLAVGAAALLYVGASTVALRRRRRGDDEGGRGREREGGRELGARAPRTALNDALGDGTGSGARATDPARTPELLTDADRVRHLLDRHGGRMKQSAIVEATDWSKAKVSRLLSSMDEEDAIEKLSLGRENVISLDREWIDAGTSPNGEADAETAPTEPEPEAADAGGVWSGGSDP
jgi:hypothetical protein